MTVCSIDMDGMPFNADLYDVLKQGDLKALIGKNGANIDCLSLPAQLLLVLATIATSPKKVMIHL
ncbi:hypothetical protein CMQ_6390 [Grosmannia clavigera kw1407]|uniref:Uncharacterized protein n=1 Tax=Grosmannia clavigera (strain kw1407 / UAMH 11150) TaxID=655863 RepID=F0XMP5_GROCL|nr:uncharacterized protein CMQ_6390 [Grosmannia clavigera kw1407]EFX01448.1 hypothetical protein CMQ_6390 [Grosmannia clavigera kw1407]